jgi:8-oxo-dGTP diphosphatase
MIRVTAAVIENDSCILIAQRKRGGHLPLKWEFPGGKIEKNETPEVCLKREMHEEFNVNIEVGELFAISIYDYSDKIVELLAYRATIVSGTIKAIAHEDMRWVAIKDLLKYDLAGADIPIAAKLMNMPVERKGGDKED